jgi:hypothetical protein
MPWGSTRCPRYFLNAHAACLPSRPFLYASINHRDHIENLEVREAVTIESENFLMLTFAWT